MASPNYTYKAAGAEVSKEAFGVLLTSQGRGYYVTLELLAIVWGTARTDSSVLPTFSDDDKKLVYARRSHDFARRLMANDDVDKRDLDFLRGDATRGILAELLGSLRVPIPNRRSMPAWGLQHLYPYVGELIHYDAVQRRSRENPASIERYTYRGGGGLIHKILRTDPDPERLEHNRIGLARLVANAGGPLGQLALACSSHDRAKESVFEDEIEPATTALPSEWVEHIRTGTRNITSRPTTTRSKQVEMLMNWLPYCLARYQLDLAAHICGTESPVLPIAQLQRPTPIRRLARQELDRSRSLIEKALMTTSQDLAEKTAVGSRRDVLLRLATNRSWREPSLSFFTQTLATCGALNAHTGSRYMTAKLPLLEALVCAALRPGESEEFENFCFETLFRRFGLVFDKRSAAEAGLIEAVDAGDFADNAAQLSFDLSGLGLLSEFSDATRMLHGEVR
jgi:hypothetical protein